MCTRIFWNDNPVAKTVSRTMDWSISDEPDLWALPAGLHRSGGASDRALSWTSAYPSVSLSMWRGGTVDGVNGAGLGAHALYLDDVDWEPADDRPTVANLMWVQYVLDTFGSVAEVVAAAPDIRIESVPFRGQTMGCHLAIEDSTGDSAILEPTGGRMLIHHGPQYQVMANSPLLDEQLANRARYRPFGGELPPPGDITSLDRFVRASYFLHYLPEPQDTEQAMAGVVHLASNVAVPYGAPYDDGGVYPTWWITATDLTNGTYCFLSTLSPNAVWVELDRALNSTEVRSLDPRAAGLSGEISDRLRPATLPY
jgi:choloylglycine hydrolase